METQTVPVIVSVSSVISAKGPLEPSYVWVIPVRDCHEDNENVRSVINFENHCSEIFQEGNISERLDDPQTGQIVCVVFRKRWVRAEVLSVSEQFVNVFLLDYGGVHKFSLSRCRRIPDGIIFPKVFILLFCRESDCRIQRSVRRCNPSNSLKFYNVMCIQ